jgi:hypothetical protein
VSRLSSRPHGTRGSIPVARDVFGQGPSLPLLAVQCKWRSARRAGVRPGRAGETRTSGACLNECMRGREGGGRRRRRADQSKAAALGIGAALLGISALYSGSVLSWGFWCCIGGQHGTRGAARLGRHELGGSTLESGSELPRANVTGSDLTGFGLDPPLTYPPTHPVAPTLGPPTPWR